MNAASIKEGYTKKGNYWVKPDGRKHQTDLANSAETWATPVGHDHKSEKSTLGLAREVKHWSTPEARDWKGHTITENHPEGYNHTLPNDAIAWPTPTAREAQHEYTDEALIRKDGKSRLDMLATMAPRWSTPTASDDEHKVTVNSSQPGLVGEVDHFNGRPVHKALKVGGKLSKSDQTSLPRLNPRFVEWLMGWPEGWLVLTNSESSATE
tara:strand:+ start:123 stop:752 length:630 start_codon:yes stop_codon:yes gene_type:complete